VRVDGPSPRRVAPAGGQPIRVGDALDRVLARMPRPVFPEPSGRPTPLVMAELAERWVELAGSELGTHSDLAAIAGPVALVRVDHPAWAEAVRVREGELVARLREAGALHVKRLRAVVRPTPPRPGRS
jgi:hypothetical protein